MPAREADALSALWEGEAMLKGIVLAHDRRQDRRAKGFIHRWRASKTRVDDPWLGRCEREAGGLETGAPVGTARGAPPRPYAWQVRDAVAQLLSEDVVGRC